MKFVLTNWNGGYYSGSYPGRCGGDVEGTTSDIADAVVFEAAVTCDRDTGKSVLEWQPELPKGGWKPVAIRMETI